MTNVTTKLKLSTTANTPPSRGILLIRIGSPSSYALLTVPTDNLPLGSPGGTIFPPANTRSYGAVAGRSGRTAPGRIRPGARAWLQPRASLKYNETRCPEIHALPQRIRRRDERKE